MPTPRAEIERPSDSHPSRGPGNLAGYRDLEDRKSEHEHSKDDYDTYSGGPKKKRRKYELQGDFLIHCHVEMHMMEGMAAMLSAIQEVELSQDEIARICYQLARVRVHECPEVGHHPCGGEGEDGWELLDPFPDFRGP